MWDARRTVGSPLAFLTVTGLFGNLLKRKQGPSVPTTSAVRIDMPATSAPPSPAAPTEKAMHPLRQDLRFKGLHMDVDPAPNVHPAEMTCSNCDRTFRYFTNGNGATTTVRCPGCARTYRV